MAATEKLSEIVSTRFTPSEAEQLRVVADGRPLSQVVRELALLGLVSNRGISASPVARRQTPSISSSALRLQHTVVRTNFTRAMTPRGGAIKTNALP